MTLLGLLILRFLNRCSWLGYTIRFAHRNGWSRDRVRLTNRSSWPCDGIRFWIGSRPFLFIWQRRLLLLQRFRLQGRRQERVTLAQRQRKANQNDRANLELG